ncbi:hypothetical protein BGZ74_006082 [Mortierella antarctica]|nr:hypothetical protein BGZ74_006082 [Mortierella antarctica]
MKRRRSNDYEVKRVVGHDRLDSYTVIYYVLWMNTDYEDALDQVLDLDCRCPVLIEEYWHRRETHGGSRVDKDGWDHNATKKQTHTVRWGKKKARTKESQAD